MIDLATCEACGAAQYPPREVCVRCLSDRVRASAVDARGVLLARTRLHRSIDARFDSRLPLDIGTVRLDAGPVAFAFLSADCGEAGSRVRLDARLEDGTPRLLASRDTAA